VSEEVKGIVKIFKEVAKPDAPGITKREFRRIFFKRDPANRHRVDTKLEDEICSDMFRILDKKGEGYVTLEDLLKHFIPRKQVLWKPFLYFNEINFAVLYIVNVQNKVGPHT
jgi:Ca2+-binding EF-hand superfamily protein